MSSVKLESSKHYIILPVKASPGARVTQLKGIQDGALKLSVTQVAEKGKANKAIMRLLSKVLQLKKSQLELVSGATAAQKKIAVQGISIDALRDRIETALAATGASGTDDTSRG